MAEGFRRLLDLLTDPQLKDLAIKRLEGYTNEEIATKRGCSLRTVERQLRLIRKRWESEIET